MTENDSENGSDAIGDGGTVVRESPSGSERSRLERLLDMKNRERYVALFTALGVLAFPYFLIEVLGVLEPLTGLSLGGYQGLPTLILIYGVVVVGYNVLLGFTGLLSFGHAAFFGVAAYAAALFSVNVVNSPLAMIVVAAVVGTLLAWPIGFLSIRRSGVYFAVLTLTFGQIFYGLAMGPMSWLTNGDDGFTPQPGELFGIFRLEWPMGLIIERKLGVQLTALASNLLEVLHFTPRYLLVGGFTVAAVVAAHRIIKSPYGLIFKALGQNEQRVEFVGLNVFRYKLMAFVISGAFAGVGGGLYTLYKTSIIHPNGTLYWVISGDFVIMTAVGGVGTLIGPLVGAAVFEYIRLVLSGLSIFGIEIGSAWRLLLGLAFVLIVAFLPKGVYGAIRGIAHRIAVKLGAETTGTTTVPDDAPSSDETPAAGKGGDD
ncbi:MAG: branched-chain amino acid ABC transporter permease [Haloglomus sp.]